MGAIFISYDTHEVELARAVASILETRLGEGVRVFVAKRDIDAGANPLKVMLEENLLKADALVALCSSRSRTSPWLWWEASAVWARGGLVVPIFVDILPKDLPGPITLVCQGRELSSRADLSSAVRAVVRKVRPTLESPDISDEEWRQFQTYSPGALSEINRDSIAKPSEIYFDGHANVERALKLADAVMRLKERESSVAKMRDEVDMLRGMEHEAQRELDDLVDRDTRHGSKAGVSEAMSIYSTRIAYCEERVRVLRERIDATLSDAGAIDQEIYELEHPSS